MNRKGFSLIELLTTVSIIGVLASIALPKYQALRKRANAAEIVSAMTTVRAGAYQYNESIGAWPGTTGLGLVPKGLAQYLPGAGVKMFRGEFHQLGWTLTTVKGLGNTTQILSASITDGVVCQATYGLWGGAANKDILGLCGPKGGSIFLWIDR